MDWENREEAREFWEWVDKITAAGLRCQESMKENKEPKEEDIQFLADHY